MDAATYRRMREQAGLSQAELHRRTGFSRTHIIRVENGHSTGSPNYERAFLAAIARNGNVTIDGPGKIASLVRSRKDLADADVVCKNASDAFAMIEKHMATVRKSLVRAAEAASLLAEGADDCPAPDEFDATFSSVENMEAVLRYITSVQIELLTAYGFDRLDPTRLDEILNRSSRHVASELKRNRARKATI